MTQQTDTIVEFMKEHDIPLTRNAYMSLAYPEGDPDEWSAEQEAMLPSEIQQDVSAIKQIRGMTVAEWAHHFAQLDRARIDMAIRGGLIAGLDNTEIARKVVGSMELNGSDGVTEITRQGIARLGQVAITSSKK
jgi:hypothetical protein